MLRHDCIRCLILLGTLSCYYYAITKTPSLPIHTLQNHYHQTLLC
uniref:Uncharacterized protein n=1 Tax=Arundo donax TaxID=35708 RepID=A0A0A9GYY8_ARUDO